MSATTEHGEMDPISDVLRAARLEGASISWRPGTRGRQSVPAVRLLSHVFRKRST
jgi:hypothetical protein